MKLRKIFAFAMLFVCAASAQAQDQPVPADTAYRTGKLANGLTYYVRHNNYPEHHVNFYIAQRVGSLQEEDSQRGLAHFLEHMAFNGTTNFKGNGVIDYTRTLGVEFGRDLNAYTSFDQTVYNINDVPSTRQSALDSCLLIIKDWSNGLLLEGEEIDKERGVIHEEWRMRNSANQRIMERNLERLYPGSKYGKRMIIGLMEVVDNFKHDEIRNYYKKWYRPDNQAIVVVGDVDVDYTVKKIQELFGAIPAPAADAAQVIDEPVPDNNEAIIISDKDKEQQYPLVQLMYKHDAFPESMKSGMSYMIYDYAKWMIGYMLNQRIAEKAQEPDCPFTQAYGYDSNYIYAKTKDAFTLAGVPKENKAVETLKAITVEALRAQKYGFTATEYARAKDEYLSQLEERYNNRDKISTERYGRAACSNFLEKEPLTSIETEHQIMNMVAPAIPVEAINQMVAGLVNPTDTNLVVLCMSPEKEGVIVPTEAQLKAAVDAAQAEKIEAYVDNVKDEPLMKEMPKKGRIVKEEKDSKLGFTKLTLSNGAVAVLKKTDFKADEIQMSAESKGGSSLYGEKDWANNTLFNAVIAQSGLGEFSNQELGKALAGKQASANLLLSTSYERISGSSTVKDLETMFQLTYLRFTAIKKDQKSYDNLMGMLETSLKNKGLRPEAVYSDSVSYTIGNHSWREKPFNVEDLKDVNYDRVLEIAKERTANAGDFTFFFVGNFDETLIRGYIEQYIASLPANGKKENYVNVDSKPQGVVLNHFKRKMETPKAITRMFWYNTKTPYSLENSIYAEVAGQVIDKIYLRKIREEASAAYSAGAYGYSMTTGDRPFTAIVGICPMKPEKGDEVLSIMRNEMTNMTKHVDDATLADIKKKMIKDIDENVKENDYWTNTLSMYVGRGIDTYTDYKKIVNEITPEKVEKFVKDVILAAGNHVEVVMLPEE